MQHGYEQCNGTLCNPLPDQLLINPLPIPAPGSAQAMFQPQVKRSSSSLRPPLPQAPMDPTIEMSRKSTRRTMQSDYSRGREMFTTTICVLMVAAIIFCAGFICGKNLQLSPTLHAKSADNLLPTSNWGDTITVDGKTVNVTDFFNTQLNEEDIKKYLS